MHCSSTALSAEYFAENPARAAYAATGKKNRPRQSRDLFGIGRMRGSGRLQTA
jgi:hypothetical protein